GVFVEFLGVAEPDIVVAKRLWRVVGHVADCSKVPANIATDTLLWASGDDPIWRLVVRSKHATLTRSGRERLAFAAAPLAPQMPRRRYEAQAGSAHITVEIDTELCVDPIAET